MTFGDKLKLIRQKNGWSQSDLAKRLNTSKQVISRYENGQTTPKITVGVQYAKALGIPIDRFLDDDLELFGTRQITAQDDQIIELFFRLPPEEQKEAMNYIKFIAETRRDS